MRKDELLSTWSLGAFYASITAYGHACILDRRTFQRVVQNVADEIVNAPSVGAA